MKGRRVLRNEVEKGRKQGEQEEKKEKGVEGWPLFVEPNRHRLKGAGQHLCFA